MFVFFPLTVYHNDASRYRAASVWKDLHSLLDLLDACFTVRNRYDVNNCVCYCLYRLSFRVFTEYDAARGILKFQCKTLEIRAMSYSVNSQAIFFYITELTVQLYNIYQSNMHVLSAWRAKLMKVSGRILKQSVKLGGWHYSH